MSTDVQSNSKEAQRAAETKKFLEWHHSLPKAEQTKFNSLVMEGNRGKALSVPPAEAVRRRLNGGRGKENYSSNASVKRAREGNISAGVSKIGDSLSRNNPTSIPNAAAAGADRVVAGIGRGASAVVRGLSKIGDGGGTASSTKAARAKLGTNEEKWAYQAAIDKGKSKKEALQAAAARRRRKN